MQKEIETLITAMVTEQKREAELLRDILAAIAVGGVARRLMVQDIAAALTRVGDVSNCQKTQEGKTELEAAIQILRNRVAA